MDNRKKVMIRGVMILLAVAALLVLSRRLVTDYGVSRDERAERESLLVNANYIAGLFGKGDDEITPLSEFKDRYYGMSAQFPMLVFESLMGDNLRHLFLARHIYTLFVCILGYLAFYFFCARVFGSRLYGLLGSAMIFLYPRFFAEQFYNIKDMVFLSIFMMMLYVTYLFVESGFKKRYGLLFTFACSVATNVRIMGCIFAACVIGYMWMMFLRDRKDLRKVIFTSLYILLGMLVFIVILTPATWHDPIHEVPNMFRAFLNYGRWNGTIVFMGQVIDKTRIPWYYVPVWLLISLPIWYLILMVVSAVLLVRGLVRTVAGKEDLFEKIFVTNRYVTLTLAACGIPWLMVAVTGATIYGGWRHLYFVTPAAVVLSLYGIKYIIENFGKVSANAVRALVIVGLMTQLIWIFRYHPFEYVYFNEAGSLFAADFDRDYWHMYELPAYRYLVEVNSSITGKDWFSVETEGADYFKWLLTEEELAKVNTDMEDADYYVASYRGIVGNDYQVEGYEEIKSFVVNGFKIATIYKKAQ